MSSIAEIRHHIKTIDDTAKITRAMHLIASGKMKKAMRAHEQTMRYYSLVRSNMRFILDNSPEGFKSGFYRDFGDRACYLVIAGDKGMCGGYNQDVLKLALRTVKESTHVNARLVTFGHMATNFMQRQGMRVDESYLTAVQNPTIDIARELGAKLCRRYRKMEFDEVFIIFTQLLKGGVTKPTIVRVLPITRQTVEDAEPMHAPTGGLDFAPSQAEALDAMDEGVPNFHLWFLANLSRLLGFRPGNDYTPGAWFDIREGLYSVVRPAHPGVMTQECASLLDRMLSCDVRRLGDVGLNRDRRSEFLNAMLAYFGYHLDAISAVQSVRILKEVF